MTISSDPASVARPVERYLGGVHHLAQPTLNPKAMIDFYVGVMGAKITHCVSSRGWRPNHYDYIHMFLDIGKGDNIAMFYYFGVEDPEDWPRYGTHHSFGADSLAELDRWAEWLPANGYQLLYRATYEVMSSLYVWDPNGRLLEIACNHRPLNEVDAEDAELTAQALIIAAQEKAKTITRMWELKAALVEEREGPIGEAALIFPQLEEFAWIPDAAGQTAARHYSRGVFDVVEGTRELRLAKPDSLPESLWWTVGTGGIKGTIHRHDADLLVIRP
jgi:catechol 2,3-dioxygenase-like lactoylglutathione lyase family enzyme